ncbi:hypothetical protein HK407_04g07480 [Ordospora pajunii]|uniref:uncharacterized protein n=1 Tax=Ordospora pajunii TaxID=3039483 RepID=UPI0029526B26|nr:uncharacterized protein HK407_04g07480 [Ordospora pajunii]KAH9411641.1 hypothetical protein HK407_04g07480 [Ordospora pajunii]
MVFKALLELPCESPELVSTAICNEDAEVNKAHVEYSHHGNQLVISLSAQRAKDLSRAINAILSRFRLCTDTVEMCKSLQK